MTTDDHKPSVPRPVLAIDHTRTPYHNSLSPPAHPSDAQPKSPPGEAEEAQRSLLIDHTQPINPDIPHKDVLFIFSNFASYMKAPNQGATGVSDQELRHALRLLEHARVCDTSLSIEIVRLSLSTGSAKARQAESCFRAAHQIPLYRVIVHASFCEAHRSAVCHHA